MVLILSMSQNGFRVFFIQGETEKKRKEKKQNKKKISLPPSLFLTGESNMNMNATCAGK